MTASHRTTPSPPDAPSARHLLIVAAGIVSLLIAGAIATVYWFEGDKEVRILCDLMEPATPRAEVARILGTASLLEVRPAAVDPGAATTLSFDTRANLRTTRCEVAFAEGAVATRDFTRAFHLERAAALLAVPLLLLLVGLQIGLATGRVSGRMAWGGFNATLTTAQRRASAFSAVLLVVVGWLLLERSGVLGLLAGRPVAVIGAWGAVLLFVLSAVGNLASISRPERRLGLPVVTALLLLSFMVAYSG